MCASMQYFMRALCRRTAVCALCAGVHQLSIHVLMVWWVCWLVWVLNMLSAMCRSPPIMRRASVQAAFSASPADVCCCSVSHLLKIFGWISAMRVGCLCRACGSVCWGRACLYTQHASLSSSISCSSCCAQQMCSGSVLTRVAAFVVQA
jgi:hypothetical protein